MCVILRFILLTNGSVLFIAGKCIDREKKFHFVKYSAGLNASKVLIRRLILTLI